MSFWARYRNAAALMLVIGLQLVLLGYQVRRNDDMTLLRAWTLGAVTPVAKGFHAAVESTSAAWRHYFWLIGAQQENDRLKRELDRLQVDNQALRRDIARLERQQQLADYRDEIASESRLAEVIGGGAGSHSKEILLNRGRRDGILPGMAVVTADGIVGRVLASYPGSSLALLIDDADSGVGVILGESRVRGMLKGLGRTECLVDYVEHEVEVTLGEVLYTSGEDRIFPKGLPVGEVVRVEPGTDFQEIYVLPYAKLDRLDEVLVLTRGTHEELPSRQPQPPEVLLPLPLDEPVSPLTEGPGADRSGAGRSYRQLTDADRLKERYRDITAAQGVDVGDSLEAPDFNAVGGVAQPAVDPPGSSAPAPEPPVAAAENEAPAP